MATEATRDTILWCDGSHGARENMRRDAALLLRRSTRDDAGTVLRLFAFRPAGITLGRSQEPARELDLSRVEAAGIEWAQRPTGGRAIYHDEEWTFSLTTTLGPGGWAADPPAAYARTCGLLARALRSMGVPVELSAGSPRGVGRPRSRGGAAAPCFASTARHELTLGGAKLAGIAQRVVRGALLQQGSLLLGPGHLQLVEWLRLPAEARSPRREALAGAAAHAGGHLPRSASLSDFADALARELPGAARREGEAAAELVSA